MTERTWWRNFLKYEITLKQKMLESLNPRVWLDDIKTGTGLNLNEMWREPEAPVAWRKCVSQVALNRPSTGVKIT